MSELKSISIDGTSYNVDLPAITAGLKAMLLDALYPVGSIYMSTDSTDPGSTLGGTWTQIKDTFLLACGIKYMGGGTGGRETVTLSAAIGASGGAASSLAYEAEGPSGWMSNHASSFNGYRFQNLSYTGSLQGNWNHSTVVTEKTGTSRDVNIMPPYLAVYVWERTA